MRVAVVGATGAVGTRMLAILEERSFPLDELVAVASARSAGRSLTFGGDEVIVQALAEDVFEDVDIAVFDVPDKVSAQWAPIAAQRGAIVVDKSATFRLDPQVPLVVPEINPQEAANRPKGIIANANCTTLAIVLPLWALHRQWGLRRLVLASYQAASGSGQAGIDDLWEQTQLAAKEADAVTSGLARDVLSPGEAFTHPIGLNFIPQCGSIKDDGYTSEELKLCHESRKILGIDDLAVTATCVRVPVMVGHGVAVHAEFDGPVDVAKARGILGSSDGVTLVDDLSSSQYPTALEAAGRDACYVGRIRADLFDERGLEMFCVADNLRKGAALNAVQIAELLVAEPA